MEVRHRLNQIAASQHSLVSLSQALDAGLSVGQIRHKASSGEWTVVRRRVYGVGGVPPTWVYEQSRAGRIPTVTLGRYRRYRREAIEAWLVEIETAAGGGPQRRVPR